MTKWKFQSITWEIGQCSSYLPTAAGLVYDLQSVLLSRWSVKEQKEPELLFFLNTENHQFLCETHLHLLWLQYYGVNVVDNSRKHVEMNISVCQNKWMFCYSPLHTLLHHSKVSISNHFSNLVLVVDDGGWNGPIPIYCEVWRKDKVFVSYWFYTNVTSTQSFHWRVSLCSSLRQPRNSHWGAEPALL